MHHRARLTGRHVGISAALLALSLGAATARASGGAGAPPAEGGPSAASAWYLDRGRAVVVDRVGSPSADALGRVLTPVRLRHAHRVGATPASIDRTAIVQIAPGAEGALAEAGVRAIRPLMPSLGIWLVEDEGAGDGLDVAARLRDRGADGIRKAAPNLYLRVQTLDAYTPNDPRFPGQWYFENLRMAEAWALTRGDASTTIVVVDSGCDISHPDLAAKMDPGLDLVDGDDDPTENPLDSGAGHGTACAGLSGAATDNGEGIAGGCPECRLRCVKVITDEQLPISALIDGYEFALQVNASVVTNSWGFVDPMPVPSLLADVLGQLFDNGRNGKGALVLFAAGNDNRAIGDDELQAARGVLAIGAINNLDEETSFTNSGNAIDLVAPTGTLSTDIWGAAGNDPSGYTTAFGGTSSACPVAAGVAGLLASAAPDRTAAEIYDVMIRTARPAPFAVPDANGHDPLFGFGIVDPVAALQELGLGEEPEVPRMDDEPEADAGCACATRAAPPPGAGAALFAAALAIYGARRARRRR